jgi:uncharacterized delta-60 repeat protein
MRPFAFFAPLLLAPAAFAQPVALDPTLDDDGYVVYDSGQHDFYYLSALPDGGFYAYGQQVNPDYSDAQSVLLRFDPDGSTNEEWGDDGTLAFDFNPGSDYYDEGFNGLTFRPDERMLLTGNAVQGPFLSNGRAFFLQLLPDGSRDPDFGEDGIVWIEYETELTYPSAPRLLADGSARMHVVFNLDVTTVGQEQLAFVQVTPDGELDDGFGDGGIQLVPGTHYTGAPFWLADGSSLVPDRDEATDSALIRRFDADGVLDTSWGDGGAAAFPDLYWIRSLARGADGQILVAASTFDQAEGDQGAALLRLTADGQRDVSFGTNGAALLDGPAWESLYTVVALADGGAISLGSIARDDGPRYALFRVDSDGQPVDDFGPGGLFEGQIDGMSLGLSSPALLPDGRVMAFSYAYNEAGDGDFVVLRFTTDLRPVVNEARPDEADAPTAERFALYPNPAAHAVTLELAPSAAPARIEAFDVLGRRVATLHDGPAGGPVRADVSGWTAGVYLVRVVREGRAETRRLTVR